MRGTYRRVCGSSLIDNKEPRTFRTGSRYARSFRGGGGTAGWNALNPVRRGGGMGREKGQEHLQAYAAERSRRGGSKKGSQSAPSERVGRKLSEGGFVLTSG